MVVAVEARALGLDFVTGRRRDVHVEVEQLGGLQPRVADVVGIADPGDGTTLDRTAVFHERVDVREDLAGVVLVREAVDHGHAGVAGEALDDLLLERADHHGVAHPGDHLRGVLDGFAATELRVARVEVDRAAAELLHPGLEREAGAGRGLLEDHDQRAVGERPVAFVALEARLDDPGAFEEIGELFAREVLELEEMLRGRHEWHRPVVRGVIRPRQRVRWCARRRG